ncbi:carbon-nitrogen hydrolase family protein [Labedaea rhizosphaerae]|uniref:Putative amidohydrolase n=1 Tax=Labedaea rhizosphaerae TaxID=598644 RepID=A0A4R6SG29_LABRH|nr:carbon-nitrogen hydrolase family protein [Labedaea rhizosphaerae]TDQ00982.1 putative amidohydrolase [Labedaea rhizosphaerae]
MTANKSLKRRVRARAAKTGESYTAALRHLRTTGEVATPEPKRVRIAIAQSPLCADPGDTAALAHTATVVRLLMRQAAQRGARVLHLPEGALCSPHKAIMSSTGPDRIGPADWSRADWAALRRELTAIAALAGELRLWTVLGSVHPLTPPHRPHNSLYVVSDNGSIVTRYDERMLSNTKVSHMYAPGTEPITFTVDGVRFGCALGMESHFAELFAEYERRDVDCVLFSTTGEPDGQVFAAEALAHAATNSYWVSYAALAGSSAPSGLAGPDGRWVDRGPADGSAAVVVTDLDESAESVEVAVFKARPWRRTARSGVYADHVVTDPRSQDRGVV